MLLLLQVQERMTSTGITEVGNLGLPLGNYSRVNTDTSTVENVNGL